MHGDDIHNGIEDAGRLPAPGWVATQRGYTRAIALESVGQGWAPLIHFLFDRIERRRESGDQPSPALPVRVVQVKEKFGGLRFYYDWLDDQTFDATHAAAFDSAVHFAEIVSFYLCERCGSLGQPQTRGWVRTLCDTHANEVSGTPVPRRTM